MRTKSTLVFLCMLVVAFVTLGGPQQEERGAAPLVTAPKISSLIPGTTRTVDLGEGIELELAWIPPGEFNMGSDHGHPRERPVHRVRISKGFWMGKYEITQAQWTRIGIRMPAVPHKGPALPVERLNRASCIDFARRLTERHGTDAGGTFRLPTEAEWEYACRAGTTTRYYTGDSEEDLDRAGWTKRNTDRPHHGGELEPNAWGLYDMHGNFWEWCMDGRRDYTSEAVIDPRGPDPTIKNRKKPREIPLPTPFAANEELGDLRGLSLEEDSPLPVKERIPTVLRGGWYIRSAERSRSASRWLLMGGGYGGGRSMRVVLEPK